MKTIKVDLGPRSYPIIIGSGAINQLGRHLSDLALGTDAYIVTNKLIAGHYGAALKTLLKKSGFGLRVKLIPDTEKSKSFKTAVEIIRDIAAFDVNKRVFVIALGGGVVGDCAGFVASIYKRGIPCVQIPTTLLGQVDSAIGGKTAVDLPEGKNLVGSFYQPSIVLSDVTFLRSLGPRQVRAGLAEVVKYAMIRDAELFSFLEANLADILLLKPSSIEFIVARCSRIKAGVVGEDEKEEKGLRTILNFGHTIGHAIEAASDYSTYNHGEAVALGMLAAADISVELKLLAARPAIRLEQLIKAIGLPTKIGRVPVNAVINAHYRDKKFIGTRNRFVLVKDVGKTVIVEDVPLEIIKSVVRKRM